MKFIITFSLLLPSHIFLLMISSIATLQSCAFLQTPRRSRKVSNISKLFSSSASSKQLSSELPTLDHPSTFPEWAYEPRDFFRYELIYQSKISQARVGRIHTPHGIIDTPGFVAVATNGALKGLDFRQADEAGQQLVFCNSYHLMLQPGPEVIEGTYQVVRSHVLPDVCVIMFVCLSCRI